MPCMGRPARPPPSPVSQPAFKFKRFGVQFQSFCCSFFLSIADFFSRTKSFIDIDYCICRFKTTILPLPSKLTRKLSWSNQLNFSFKTLSSKYLKNVVSALNALLNVTTIFVVIIRFQSYNLIKNNWAVGSCEKFKVITVSLSLIRKDIQSH